MKNHLRALKCMKQIDLFNFQVHKMKIKSNSKDCFKINFKFNLILSCQTIIPRLNKFRETINLTNRLNRTTRNYKIFNSTLFLKRNKPIIKINNIVQMIKAK